MYMPTENANKIMDVLNKALSIRNDLIFSVYDSSSYYGKSSDPHKIIELIDGGAEEIAIKIRVKNTDNILGWLYLLPYECDVDCIVFDHTDNEFCDKIME